MRINKTLVAMAAFSALLGPVAALAVDDGDVDRSHPKAFVKDSVITTKIKTKLAAENLKSLIHIHVDTDANGAVWLSGTAPSQDAIDKALAIARGTENVASVHSEIKLQSDK